MPYGKPEFVEGGDSAFSGIAVRASGIGFLYRFITGFISMNGIKYLTPVDRYFLRGFHAQANLVPTNFNNDNCNVVIDYDTLVLLSR
jgi:hypothetical protein